MAAHYAHNACPQTVGLVWMFAILLLPCSSDSCVICQAAVLHAV